MDRRMGRERLEEIRGVVGNYTRMVIDEHILAGERAWAQSVLKDFYTIMDELIARSDYYRETYVPTEPPQMGLKNITEDRG